MTRLFKTTAVAASMGLVLFTAMIARAQSGQPSEDIHEILSYILERLDRTPPTWDSQIRGNDRFRGLFALSVCVDPSSPIDPTSPFPDPICQPPQATAALDRETGLVWERYVAEERPLNWFDAQRACHNRVAVRRGWRLPRAEELASLLELTARSPALPAGHPFLTERGLPLAGGLFWSATTDPADPSQALVVSFLVGRDPVVRSFAKQSLSGALWCVRGGNG